MASPENRDCQSRWVAVLVHAHRLTSRGAAMYRRRRKFLAGRSDCIVIFTASWCYRSWDAPRCSRPVRRPCSRVAALSIFRPCPRNQCPPPPHTKSLRWYRRNLHRVQREALPLLRARPAWPGGDRCVRESAIVPSRPERDTRDRRLAGARRNGATAQRCRRPARSVARHRLRRAQCPASEAHRRRASRSRYGRCRRENSRRADRLPQKRPGLSGCRGPHAHRCGCRAG